jgi:DNA polymerase-4
VPADRSKEFLAPLPISRLWGVGAKMERELHLLGLSTIGDVANKHPVWLEQKLGALGLHLYALSQGIDDRHVVPDRGAKSIGSEDTFGEDVKDRDTLSVHIHSQALRVARRMRKAGVRARAVMLKVKLSDFSLLTRRTTMNEPSDDGQTLFNEAMGLLDREWPLPKRVRLTGVSAQELVGGTAQLDLFDTHVSKSKRLNFALDEIAKRFGSTAITTADLAGTEGSDEDEEARRLVGASRFLDRAKR